MADTVYRSLVCSCAYLVLDTSDSSLSPPVNRVNILDSFRSLEGLSTMMSVVSYVMCQVYFVVFFCVLFGVQHKNKIINLSYILTRSPK